MPAADRDGEGAVGGRRVLTNIRRVRRRGRADDGPGDRPALFVDDNSPDPPDLLPEGLWDGRGRGRPRNRALRPVRTRHWGEADRGGGQPRRGESGGRGDP